MREARIDILDAFNDNDAVCVTTNGERTQRGLGIMGAGVALAISQVYVEAPSELGRALTHRGNVPTIIGWWGPQAGFKTQRDDFHYKPLWTFPTKLKWKDPSDIRLIVQSAKLLDWEMKNYFLKHSNYSVALPKPGCQNGGLQWSSVKERLEPLLDGHYLIIDKAATVHPIK